MEVQEETINLIVPQFPFLSSLHDFHLPGPLLLRWVSMLPDNEKVLKFCLLVLEIAYLSHL